MTWHGVGSYSEPIVISDDEEESDRDVAYVESQLDDEQAYDSHEDIQEQAHGTDPYEEQYHWQSGHQDDDREASVIETDAPPQTNGTVRLLFPLVSAGSIPSCKILRMGTSANVATASCLRVLRPPRRNILAHRKMVSHARLTLRLTCYQRAEVPAKSGVSVSELRP